jgi:hypothetical protein
VVVLGDTVSVKPRRKDRGVVSVPAPGDDIRQDRRGWGRVDVVVVDVEDEEDADKEDADEEGGSNMRILALSSIALHCP